MLLNRLNVSLVAFKWYAPEHYVPTWMEVVVAAAVISAEVWVFRWVVSGCPCGAASPTGRATTMRRPPPPRPPRRAPCRNRSRRAPPPARPRAEGGSMDFIASNGIEYLMVIGYLALSIPFWLLLERWTRPARTAAPVWIGDPVGGERSWFAVPDGPSYHRGHTWAPPVGAGRYRVAVDDFARRSSAHPYELDLPAVGARLAEGEPGFRFRLDGRSVDLLSPVAGRVVALNGDVLADPGRVSDDPTARAGCSRSRRRRRPWPTCCRRAWRGAGWRKRPRPSPEGCRPSSARCSRTAACRSPASPASCRRKVGRRSRWSCC